MRGHIREVKPTDPPALDDPNAAWIAAITQAQAAGATMAVLVWLSPDGTDACYAAINCPALFIDTLLHRASRRVYEPDDE